MNFEDMKTAWSNDPGKKDIEIPTALDKIKTAGMPVEKIRKMMLRESYLQAAGLIIMFFSPSVFTIDAKYLQSFYYLYAVFVMICIYYFLKFYFFYKRLNNVTLNSKDNLYTLYYDIRLNVEMYKSFSYTLSPFALVYVFMYLSNRLSLKVLHLNNVLTYVCLFTAVLSVILTIVFTEYWVKKSYGHYAAQVKAVLNELIED